MSLSPLYALAKFPRVSAVSQRATVAKSSTDEHLYIAISGASVSHYVLKPSPKVVWSHSVPPSYVITALETVRDLFIIGVTNKSSHLVQVIRSEENGSEVVEEWTADGKVLSINAIAEKVIVVTEKSTTCYVKNEQKWSVKALYTTVFAQLIENDVTLIVEHHAENLHFSLLSAESHEISSKIVEAGSLQQLKFCYKEGVLTQFANGEFTEYSIPHFTALKTVSLAALGITGAEQPVFLSPALDRLLLSQGHELYLVNTKFEIVLSHISFAKSTLELLFTQGSKRQQLTGVVLKEHDLSGVTFTLDSNTLKDAMGKKKSANKPFTSVPSILDIKNQPIHLESITGAKDLDSALLNFLQAEQDYYTENDVVVESRFMTAIVQHIFTLSSIPERAMTYLLTHPLFPTVPGLLSLLRRNPRLLRQAIVTGNVSIDELIAELNTTESEEIFKDIITRLLEFPREKLAFKDLDSSKIVQRIIQLNFGFELVSLLIDASGLFTWNAELVQQLQEVLSNKIDALGSAANVAAVLEQMDTKTVKSQTRVPVYSVERLSV